MVILRIKLFLAMKHISHSVVNKQNCRILGPENAQIIEERPLHPEIVSVLCALWSEGVIGCDIA